MMNSPRIALPYVAFLFGCLALGISFMSIVGHAIGNHTFYDWSKEFGRPAMSLPTSVTSGFLSISMIALAIHVIERRDLRPTVIVSHPQSAGFSRRETITATAAAACLIAMVFTFASTGDNGRLQQQLEQRERALIDREAKFQITRQRYEAAVQNQLGYFRASRGRWGGFGYIVTAFLPRADT